MTKKTPIIEAPAAQKVDQLAMVKPWLGRVSLYLSHMMAIAFAALWLASMARPVAEPIRAALLVSV